MGKGGCEGDLIRRHKFEGADVISKDVRSISVEEVSTHDKENDCWIIIKGKVYDVTKFLPTHPGGKVLFTYAGKDATDVFSVFHSPSTWTLLSTLQIGLCQDDEPTNELLRDFRALRTSLMNQKLFDASPLYYTYKTISTFSLLAASVAMAAYLSHSWTFLLASAALLALFYQQTGWLAHDFLHHQVFKWRSLNHLVGGAFLGNVCQGFSGSWWLAKHNTHHAAPNECDEEYRAVDPDIDTLPILAWSKEMLDTVQSKGARAFLKWQHFLFFPVLMFARFAWLYGSILFVATAPMTPVKRTVEASLLAVHYGVLVIGACLMLPLTQAIAWCLMAEVFGGLFLGIVFVLSHNGMEIYSDDKDFYSSQIISTRDVTSSVFHDWFTGGLNRQIEHHLFPTMPRHNLKYCSDKVRALCSKHGLVFEDVGIAQGTALIVGKLAQIAAHA